MRIGDDTYCDGCEQLVDKPMNVGTLHFCDNSCMQEFVNAVMFETKKNDDMREMVLSNPDLQKMLLERASGR